MAPRHGPNSTLPCGAGKAGGVDLGELTGVSRVVGAVAFLVWLVVRGGVFAARRTIFLFSEGTVARARERSRALDSS
jgi:hypothetical protein